MRIFIALFACVMALSSPQMAEAAQRSVTLDVQKMTCAACPITVKKALEHVTGVSRVDVNFEKKTALVDFDDALSSVAALTQATEDAGYPSTVRESAAGYE
ncbi:MAG: mercury resistance system periplasmic binding protein MerP [Alphaproteobacteria bacterium]|nr:mercury resistance system periplasmic binding protein MerP [Alphaproteobacteria bacterium]